MQGSDWRLRTLKLGGVAIEELVREEHLIVPVEKGVVGEVGSKGVPIHPEDLEAARAFYAKVAELDYWQWGLHGSGGVTNRRK